MEEEEEMKAMAFASSRPNKRKSLWVNVVISPDPKFSVGERNFVKEVLINLPR